MCSKTKRYFLKKVKSSRGETITETLVSLLIIVLAMTMLAGSIVSASKVNRQVKDSIEKNNENHIVYSTPQPTSYIVTPAPTPVSGG